MATSILYVENATVAVDGFTILDQLNLMVEPGELRFLIGPNGAGKTTLLDMLTGRIRPLSGRVLFDLRHDLTRMQEHQIVRLGIGRKFQTPAVFASLTCFENLEVALGFRARLPALFRRLPSEDSDRIQATLARVGLAERTGAIAGALSHGEQQWLEIAMLLVQDPKVLLLDEPVAGMSQRERALTGELLHALEGDHTLLVIEHDMDFVRRFSRTVTVLHMGRVLREGTMETVQRDEQVAEVYLGRSARAVGAS